MDRAHGRRLNSTILSGLGKRLSNSWRLHRPCRASRADYAVRSSNCVNHAFAFSFHWPHISLCAEALRILPCGDRRTKLSHMQPVGIILAEAGVVFLNMTRPSSITLRQLSSTRGSPGHIRTEALPTRRRATRPKPSRTLPGPRRSATRKNRSQSAGAMHDRASILDGRHKPRDGS